MYGVENDAMVFFAKNGYYKGKQVTLTHRNAATGEVWLEDFPVGKAPVVYGCWVNGDSVRYEGEKKDENNKRRSEQADKKIRRKQGKYQKKREE